LTPVSWLDIDLVKEGKGHGGASMKSNISILTLSITRGSGREVCEGDGGRHCSVLRG